MRLTEQPFERTHRRISFFFEGQAIEAFEGETIAAALSAADIVDLRDGKRGDRRGMFCGMGVCFECLVTVGQRNNIRSCMEPAVAGAEVCRQAYPGGPSGERGVAARPETVAPDVVVVGAGPAGL